MSNVVGNDDHGYGVKGTSYDGVGVLGICEVISSPLTGAVAPVAGGSHFGKHVAGAGGLVMASETKKTAVLGMADHGDGVAGISQRGNGIWGKSDNGKAGLFTGDVQVDGKFNQNGDATHNGKVTHNGEVTHNRNVTHNGEVTHNGDVTHNGGVAVNGTIQIGQDQDGNPGDIILGDCSEEFELLTTPLEEASGSVMVVDDTGAVRPCDKAYDKRAIGVISGAGQFRPAIVLGRVQSDTNRAPIALVGKVCCKVDATFAPVEVGDLLTTSPTVGYAMKATDPMMAFGTVIGKAIEPLKDGRGLVRVVVNLQ